MSLRQGPPPTIMISSLSFRMFMFVFPVCHVLNYEYAENNNKKNNNNNTMQALVSSLSESFDSLPRLPATYSVSVSLFVLLLRGRVMDRTHCGLCADVVKFPRKNMAVMRNEECSQNINQVPGSLQPASRYFCVCVNVCVCFAATLSSFSMQLYIQLLGFNHIVCTL